MAKSKSRKSNQKSFSKKKTFTKKKRSRRNTHLKIMKGGSEFTLSDFQNKIKSLRYQDSHGNYIKFTNKPDISEHLVGNITGREELFDDSILQQPVDNVDRNLPKNIETIVIFLQKKSNKIKSFVLN